MAGVAVACSLLSDELTKLHACATKKYPVSGKQYARVFLEDGTVVCVGPDGALENARVAHADEVTGW